MAKASKIRASKQAYVSPSQLVLDGFETPFANQLDAQNRWVKLAHKIPWDSIVNVYEKQMHNSVTGASNILCTKAIPSPSSFCIIKPSPPNFVDGFVK